jgi:TM2 domain-containing membrane protein YozV
VKIDKLLLLLFVFIGSKLLSKERVDSCVLIQKNQINTEQIVELNITAQMNVNEYSIKRPNPLFFIFKKKQTKNKKIVAALLAFPFPFGMVGLHRIYLGTAPYVPIIYIGTIGGGFGILPFIDFCVLLLDKDVTRYNENKKVFMWVND